MREDGTSTIQGLTDLPFHHPHVPCVRLCTDDAQVNSRGFYCSKEFSELIFPRIRTEQCSSAVVSYF